MKKLTVFTPTYNRAYLLPQLYKSLCDQSSADFLWLVVDDGSSDNTKELVERWQRENKIQITYVFQDNQGMHGAHNTAYENCKTSWNVCIDSDDYMPKNAVELILKNIEELKDSSFAGLVGLDADKATGKIIGTEIPAHLKRVKLNELYTVHNVKGDKKLVLNTAVVKQFPKYPLFKNERFVPLDYLYLLIDQEYDLKPVNEIFCIVEYQTDGSTKNIIKQYRRNPNGFAFSRVSRINYGKTFKERFKNAVHLVSSIIFSKKINWLLKTKRPLLVFSAIPFGIILNLYIRFKYIN